MSLQVRAAGSTDAATLASIAALTFPLACPPSASPESIAAHIAANFTEAHFAGYLADTDHKLTLAFVDGVVAGYSMVVLGEPTDADVVAAISIHPTSELSKIYVAPGHHGAGVSQALMDASIEVARQAGAAGMWLGVNNENVRANRFYAKSGFVQVGTKRFYLADHFEDDFVRERSLG